MQSLRLKQLPPYLFADLDRKKRELRAKGADIIDLSVGDPDPPTPGHIIDALCAAARDKKNHCYPPYNGTQEFREAAAVYLKKSRAVSLNPDTEILTLIGSKEGIAHMPFAVANPGDIILVPSPGYPVYSNSSILAGCVPYEIPLRKENDFLSDLDAIPKEVIARARILFLNYPNNPTAATASKEFFGEVVLFGLRHGILICHDAAYLEVTFDGYKAPSILEVDGAKETAVEFHSLSKSYNMTGWRLGFAAGNMSAIASLAKMKTNIDSSATAAVQHAGAIALTSSQACIAETCAVYKERRDIVVEGLAKADLRVVAPKATFYIWAEQPCGGDYAGRLLEKTGVVVTPGLGFGTYGKGFVRLSLTVSTERIKEAMDRIQATVHGELVEPCTSHPSTSSG